jgi:hypothetical protein
MRDRDRDCEIVSVYVYVHFSNKEEWLKALRLHSW